MCQRLSPKRGNVEAEPQKGWTQGNVPARRLSPEGVDTRQCASEETELRRGVDTKGCVSKDTDPKGNEAFLSLESLSFRCSLCIHVPSFT